MRCALGLPSGGFKKKDIYVAEQFLKCLLKKLKSNFPGPISVCLGQLLQSKHDYKAIQVKAERKRLRYLKFYHHRDSP